MKILIDDTFKSVESENDDFELIKFNCIYQMRDGLKIILSYDQLEKFIGYDTAREFNVSKRKIEKLISYMENNIWNKPK